MTLDADPEVSPSYVEIWATNYERLAGPLDGVIEQLDRVLGSRRTVEKELLTVIGQRLEGEIDTDTWQVIYEQVAAFGIDETKVSGLLAWVVTNGTPVITELEGSVSARVSGFLRLLLAEHKPELMNAFRSWREDPDDWSGVYREVLVDLISQVYKIEVRIDKVNGEQLFLAGPARSLLNLAWRILDTLRLTGSPDAFEGADIAGFRRELVTTLEFFQPSSPEADDGPSGLVADAEGPAS